MTTLSFFLPEKLVINKLGKSSLAHTNELFDVYYKYKVAKDI